jgi:3-methyladenine DNA glycosylase AlkD
MSDRDRLREALAWLEKKGSKRVREEAKTRYGVDAPQSFGVPVGAVQQLAKQLGKDHQLAAELWATGWYEARLLCAYVDEVDLVTPAQMDRWVRDFDNWGIVDTVCFVLFDKSKHAWSRVEPWCKRKEEFVRRAGFVMLACLGLHDKAAPDARFLTGLALIEKYAGDDRNFVRKGVSWALRVIGGRNAVLNAAARESCQRLIESGDPVARSIGTQGMRELKSVQVTRRFTGRRKSVKS